jgi:Tol biopolymer transport system component
MTPERYEFIAQLFNEALALAPEQRSAWLEEACGGDVNLRAEVEKLLSNHLRASGFLDSPMIDAAASALAQKQHSLATGKWISHYQIVSLLGAGGMGEVFLAEDTRLKRKVALKVLPAMIADDADRLRRFEREAYAVSTLNHPNILTVHEFGWENGVHFLVMELVEGVTLRQKISHGQLPLGDALSIAEQTAFALAAAHAAGIIHRDLKPENIMLRDDGIVKVLDFGLAKLTEPPAQPVDSEGQTLIRQTRQTKQGAILGTPHYMSPEQARGQSLDARTDIFSLGVILYEMLMGKDPFDRPTTIDVIAAILTENPPPIAEQRRDASPALQHIVNKAIAKKLDNRYQTSKDLLADLKELRSELEFSAKLERITGSAKALNTKNVTQSPAALSAARRFSLAYAAALLSAVVLIIAAAWLFFARGRSETFLPASLKSVEITSWPSAPGEVYSVGSFSPDGKVIAFTSARSGSKNIWVKQTASGEAIQITKDDFANENPIWSPTGEEIAYFSIRGNHPGIWRIPAFGGAPTLIATLEDGSAWPRRWSKNGSMIYYESKRNLFSLDIKSGRATQLTDLSAARVNSDSISISPDERQIAYISTAGDGRSGVWVAPLRGGAARQIANDAGHNRNAIWSPDAKSVLYSANIDGVYQIFAANLDERKPAQVTFGDLNSFALDVSSDGARVLYGSTKEESDVWGVNLAGGEEFALTSDLGCELWPDVSPDGKTLAYQAVRNLSQGDKISNCAILTRRLNPASSVSSDEPSRLADDGALPKWSPDGKQIAFLRLVGRTQSLWTVTTDGEKKQLTTGGLPSIEYTLLPYLRAQASSFSWAPDGHSIAYCSNRSGQQNIWLISADGSRDAQLTNNGDPNLFVKCPLWSADGKFIAHTTRANETPASEKIIDSVWVTEVGTKNSKAIFQSESFARMIGWAQGDKELILAVFKGRASNARPAEVALVRISAATGEQRPLAVLPAAYLYNIHLSADRKTIAFTSRQDGKDNVWIIPATGGEPKRLTANNDIKLYFSSLSWSPDGRAVYFGRQSRHSLLSMITNFK